jgi:hypothetical protein
MTLDEAEKKIRKLEVELKETKLTLHKVRGNLVAKNRALLEIRNLVQATFNRDYAAEKECE